MTVNEATLKYPGFDVETEWWQRLIEAAEVKTNRPSGQAKEKRSLISQASLGLVVCTGLEPVTPSM